MKVIYDKEIDSKYVKIGTARKVAKTKKHEDWLLVDHDSKGHVIGVEILWASKHPMIFSISKKKFFSYFQIPKNSAVNDKKKSKSIFFNTPLGIKGVVC